MSLQKYRADFAGTKQDDGAIPYYTRWMGGSTLALVSKCRITNTILEVSPRTVYVSGVPDTWFSIPATCRYKGRTITGYITSDDIGYVFRAHNNQL